MGLSATAATMVAKRNRTLGSFIVNTKTVSPVARAYGERTDMYIRLSHVFKKESKKIKRREASFVSCARIEANDTTKNMELRFYVSFSCICAFSYDKEYGVTFLRLFLVHM